ncbi:histone deacetylase clr3 [Vararia minispora EC-137]|uniref:Histone deacetylase clr3 n=1 Tax=Vararia minispora EC-137 TaxID=1314806 RepID=A0ACB8QWG8_9AGAM|nr:histone deacetylase clr3 [Vararia minispora EC-137]
MPVNGGMRAASVPLIPERQVVGYVYSEQMMLHNKLNTDPDDDEHPEKPARIEAVHGLFEKNSLIRNMKRLPIRPVREDEVLLVHSRQLWNDVQKLSHFTYADLINSAEFYEHKSLYVCSNTPLAARISCGGVIEACLAVARGDLQKAFANVRPPGHHAEPDECMGFCFFNNVAVAARVVQQQTKVRKIMILDWDVHHGNGTQRAFEDDPSVLYISMHRYENGEFYPNGTYGAMDSCGDRSGRGYSVNIPWSSAGMGDAEYILAMQSIVMPIASEFAPQLVIISSGFDAAEGDPLGECHVSPAGYAHMTHMLSGLAGGRVVAALEGGYNVDAVARSALAVGRTLLGESPPEMAPLMASEEGAETIFAVAKYQSRFWKNIDVRACEPQEGTPSVFSILELLKAHRTEYMYREFGMLELPLMQEYEQLYTSQAMCSQDLMKSTTVVVFVHEFGNIKADIANSLTCEVQKEHSYLVDASKLVTKWCKEEHYALMDINLYPKRPLITRSEKESARGVMTYIWDNYLLLSGATNFIFIGHGQGVLGVMELINARSATVQRHVLLVAQFVGLSPIPLIPKHDDVLTSWYLRHSMIIIPPDHQVRKDGRMLKRHGKTVIIGLLLLSMPFS